MLLNPDGTKFSDFNGETGKAYARRLSEGWFDKYAPEDKVGLDIGCGTDPLNQTFRRYDQIFNDGDANYLDGIPSNMYWTVYASHVLEHMKYPRVAIKRWYEVVRPGGHLIISLPHRDLYEKKKMLPSNWNEDHKYFWLPDDEEPPCTKSLRKEILAAIPNADIVYLEVMKHDYVESFNLEGHPAGEYSIEAVIKKNE